MIGRRLVLALVCGAAWFATASSAQTNHVIDVINPMNFDPPEVTIQVGDTVTFQKGNTSPGHNVRSDGFTNGCTQSATCFRSGPVTSGSFTLTLDVFDSVGTFPFFCELHGGSGGFGMAGRIIVEGGAPGPTPTPTPPPPPTNDAGAIRFTNGNYSRAENVGDAAIQVERFSGDDGAVSVSFSTTNGSATAGQDYTTAMGTLNWADGEDGTKTFNVTIANDGDDETNETVSLHLASPTGGAGLGNPSNATMTIVDDDIASPTGTVEFTNTAFEVAETSPQATVSVRRSGGSQGAASVEYDTANGSATAGQDYTAVGGTLNWANGDGADKSFDIPILDDIDSEAAETLSIALSQPTGVTLGAPANATLTILDNESVPPCTDGDFQVCLLGRFLATIHWVRPNNEGEGEGRALKLTDSAASFEFFEVGNVEVVLKMKDGCALPPGHPLRNFWPFVAGLTNVRVELTIIDTESGAMRRFFNDLEKPFFTPAPDSPDGQGSPPGAIQATTEALGAFPTCDV